jgi:hypothetical protein
LQRLVQTRFVFVILNKTTANQDTLYFVAGREELEI